MIVPSPNTTTLATLAALYFTSVQAILDVNTQLSTYSGSQFLEANAHIFIPPCTAGTPPPAVPTAACGFTYFPQLTESGTLATLPSLASSSQTGSGRRSERRLFGLHAAAGLSFSGALVAPSATPPVNINVTDYSDTVAFTSILATSVEIATPLASTVTVVAPVASFVLVS